MGAARKMIDVTPEDLLACNILCGKYVDGGVRTGAFAHAAGGTAVVAVCIFDHFEATAITFVHFERLAVFGVLFRNNAFRTEKILERNR